MKNNRDIQVVVLAGGKGTRMGDGELPKILTPLAGRPLLSYILDVVEKLSLDNKPVIVVGYKRELVEKEFGSDYIYAFQEKQLGTAHAVLSAKSSVTAPHVMVLYSDMPFVRPENLQKFIQTHLEIGAKVSMFTAHVPNFDGAYGSILYYGRIVRNSEDGRMEASVEYRDCTPEQKEITEVNPCFYMFESTWLWSRLEKLDNQNAQGEYYLTDLVHQAIAEGEKINIVVVPPEEVIGVNSPDDLLTAERLVDYFALKH